jgi:hypothetical protein
MCLAEIAAMLIILSDCSVPVICLIILFRDVIRFWGNILHDSVTFSAKRMSGGISRKKIVNIMEPEGRVKFSKHHAMKTYGGDVEVISSYF